jgi:Spy/CpxP family protein refolding chaperone
MHARLFPLVAFLAAFAPGALAQHQQAPGHSPYTSFETREIKALSPEDIAGLKAGRGMSLALAAELNGYPGPLHVLELESQLKLSVEQRARTEAVMERMRQNAQATGAKLIEAERHLDMRFRHRHIDPASLADKTTEIGLLQAELRRIHLEAHLDMVAILTPEQIEAYNLGRGYASGQGQHKH